MERLELAKILGWRRGNATVSGQHCFSPFDASELQKEFRAVAAGRGVFLLCDPSWGHREHDQVDELLAHANEPAGENLGWFCLPTGGTSGGLRFARHDQNTLIAAAQGFREFLNLDRVNTVGVLPLYHISGFMSWFRCAISGGAFVDWSWKELEAGHTPDIPAGDDWVISVVPTQLQRLLTMRRTMDWLRRFRAVLVGGAAAWPALIERAAKEKIPVSLTYGMTETCAMVSASWPEEFHADLRHVGKPLPHVDLSLSPEGLVSIRGESVYRGYYPNFCEAREHISEDLAEFDQAGNLRILGRRDALIISGGKKIAPSEVEAALLATGLLEEAVVMGFPDMEWGQQVVAFIPKAIDEKMEETLDALMRESLAAYKRPRRYVSVQPWPKNAQGKVNREALRASLWTGSEA